MIFRIDDYLIDNIFQKISEKYQIHTNKTNFYLARILFYLVFAINTPLILFLATITDNHFVIYLIIGATLLFYVYFFSLMKLCEKLDKKYENIDEISEFNPIRKDKLHFTIRTTALLNNSIIGFHFFVFLLFFPSFFAIAGLADLLIIISGLYLAACLPIPGKRLKEIRKEKIRKLELAEVS